MAEIFGTDIFEAAKDKLLALMTTLITNMAADDPAIGYAYDYHNIVDISFNAVSLQLDSASQLDNSTPTVSATGVGAIYDMEFSIRIHIDHIDGKYDSVKVARLMNSVSNKLHKNKDLGTGFRIQYTADYKFNEEFDLSDTLGGEFLVMVRKFANHAQE